MVIVATMRRTKALALAFLATLMMIGMTAPAGATPVVDQYTEQIPTPGGPKPLGQGDNGPGKGTNSEGNGTGLSGGSEDPTAVSPDSPVSNDGSGAPVSGSGGTGNGPDASGGASQSSSESGTATGMFKAAGDDDGGMGWLFPAALILVTGTIVGFAIGRRNRTGLAT